MTTTVHDEMREYEKKILREYRANIIEECARVAESFNPMHRPVYPSRIAAAIRALKEKPC